MKKKVGELYDKPIVIGNHNDITKDEILLKNNGGGITLSERKDGELKNITNTSSFSPRCFILDTADLLIAEGVISYSYGTCKGSEGVGNSNVIMIADPSDPYGCWDNNNDPCDIETWISINKEHIVAEISYEEFLGNKVDGYFSKIRLVDPGNTESSETESPYFLDDFSKQRINYLKDNPNKAKYNFISITAPSKIKPAYAQITNFFTFAGGDNKEYARIEIESIPPFGNIRSIIIPFNAEVLK
jgi:hypothetical protein